jgi:hypothetical protein
MARKKKYSPRNWYLPANDRGEKCPYCHGRNGEAKDIYETQREAENAAHFIGNTHGIPLKVYPCPHGPGWHLTKNDMDYADSGGWGAPFANQDIPRKSSNTGSVSWEYETSPEPPLDNGPALQRPPVKKKQPPPIVKIECKTGSEEMPVRGKIMEVVENIDAAAYFGINENNPFAAVMIKDMLNKPLLQITIYAATGTGQTGSYTILIDQALFKQNNMKKGNTVSLTIKAKAVNSKKAWYCIGSRPAGKPK